MKLNLSPESQAREIEMPRKTRLMCVGGILDGRTRDDCGEFLRAIPARPFPRLAPGETPIEPHEAIHHIIYRAAVFAKPHVSRRFYVLEGMSDADALAAIERKGLMP